MLRFNSLRTLIFTVVIVAVSAVPIFTQAAPRGGGEGDVWWDVSAAFDRVWSMVWGAGGRGPSIDPVKIVDMDPGEDPDRLTGEQAAAGSPRPGRADDAAAHSGSRR